MKTALAKYPGAFFGCDGCHGVPKRPISFPAVLPLCQDEGVYYAIPWDIAPAMMFYRTDIF